MITIYLNGSATPIGGQRQLSELVLSLTDAPRGIAVAVNESVIPKSEWAVTSLADGDRVEVLTAAPGG